jgi:hypothetical protein
MVNRRSLKVFWLQWLIANLVSSGIGFSLPFSLPAVRIFFEWHHRMSFGIDSPGPSMCMIAAIFMGVAQWLVLRKRISRLYYLWIVTSSIGLLISSFITLVLGSLDGWSREFSSFIQTIQNLFLYGILGGFIGGLLIGTAQCLVLRRWRSWILLNGIAWGFAWAIALATTRVVDRLLYIKLNVYDVNGSIQLIIFGSILGFISSLFTGSYLVWLLKRDGV